MLPNDFVRPRFLLLPIFAAAIAMPLSLSAAVVTMYWEGTISSITSFAQDSVPAGVALGASIFGSAVFEATQSSSQERILGSHTFGTRFRFGEPLTLTITTAPSEWRFRGGKVGLIGYSNEDKEAIDVYSTSDFSRAESFPNEVGPFEVGFVFLDDRLPLALFDVPEIENTFFDLAQMTVGSGFLTTRRWDMSGEIVEGYYITFDIHRASPTPVPERTSSGLVTGALCMALLGRRPRQKCT